MMNEDLRKLMEDAEKKKKIEMVGEVFVVKSSKDMEVYSKWIGDKMNNGYEVYWQKQKEILGGVKIIVSMFRIVDKKEVKE